MILIRYIDGVYQNNLETDVVKLDKESGMSYQPSGSKFWLECAGYSILEDTGMSDAAFKGIKAHEEAEKDVIATLTEGVKPKLEYTKYIQSKIPAKGTVIIGVEVFLQSRDIRNFRGFVDCIIVQEKKKQVEIIDFKSGFRKVSAISNEQLGCYLKLLNDSDTRLTREKEDFRKWSVVFTIHQLDKVSTWSVPKRWGTAFIKAVDKHFEKYKGVVEKSNNLFNYRSSCISCFRATACPKMGGTIKKSIQKVNLSQLDKASITNIEERELIDLWIRGKTVKKAIDIVQKELDRRHKKGLLELVDKVDCASKLSWVDEFKEVLLKDTRFVQETLIKPKDAEEKMSEDEVKKFLCLKTSKTFKTNELYITGGN